tara:strand:+ start:364 stop:606 length:243 start_codon:yes stop_codon:yes gene_type:complete
VTSSIDSSIVSTVNGEIESELVILSPESDITFETIIIQSVYVPSNRVFKVIVLFPAIAEVVLEEQEPLYVIAPVFEDENV